MRYIKRFNESKKELQELINGSLSYLLDDPTIIVKIGQVLGEDQYLVTLTKSSEDAKMDIMEWNDIKDSFIPLLQILSNDYDFVSFNRIDAKDRNYNPNRKYGGEILNIQFTIERGYSTGYYTMSIDDVINDSTYIPNRIFKISIVVKI